MDQDKKQKLMLGIVAVAILGAGGFWWISSGSGNRNVVQEDTGPLVRAQRAETEDIDRGPIRAERTEVQREQRAGETLERAERREAPRTEVRRATRGREDRRREREQEVLPAS